jgi:hypothetical protein
MKTKSIIGLIFSILSLNSFAQSPEKVNYQAIVRDINNVAVANQSVGVKFTITQSLPNGTVVYEETHNPTTNSHGLINLKIGTGIISSGTFASINWSVNSHYLTSAIDPTGGSNYTLTGVSEMVSVPYALHAKTVDDKDDADADPANEIQTVTVSGSTATLSNGGGTFSLDDADADDTNELQNLQIGAHILKITSHPSPTGIDLSPYLDNTNLTEAQVDAFVANNGYVATEVDGSVTNEIQTLSVSGSTATLSNGGGAISINDADASITNEIQTVTLSGSTATLSNGGGSFSVNDADANATNEIQALSVSGSTVTLSNGGGSISINDADASTTNEIQVLSVSGSTATLSNGGGSISINDADASATNEIQTLSISGSDLTISGTGGNTITLPTAASSLKVGDTHQGGIIVYLNPDGISGLIVATTDLASNDFQSGGSDTYVPGASDYYDGEANTTALMASPSTFEAAAACDAYGGGGFNDWFLPSYTQWIIIYNNLYALGGFNFGTGIYWTSTQTGLGTTAVSFYLSGSGVLSYDVDTQAAVRPMRSF